MKTWGSRSPLFRSSLHCTSFSGAGKAAAPPLMIEIAQSGAFGVRPAGASSLFVAMSTVTGTTWVSRVAICATRAFSNSGETPKSCSPAIRHEGQRVAPARLRPMSLRHLHWRRQATYCWQASRSSRGDGVERLLRRVQDQQYHEHPKMGYVPLETHRKLRSRGRCARRRA